MLRKCKGCFFHTVSAVLSERQKWSCVYLEFSSHPHMHLEAADLSLIFSLHIPAKQKCLAVVSSTDQSML